MLSTEHASYFEPFFLHIIPLHTFDQIFQEITFASFQNDLTGERAYVNHTFLGVCMCTISCFFTSGANALMKMDAELIEHDAEDSRPLFTRRLVGLAVVLYISGALLDFGSLIFISMSIRACSSCFTVPCNACIARLFLRERMTSVQICGAVCTVTGAILAMLSGSNLVPDKHKSIRELFSNVEFVIFFGIVFFLHFCSLLISRWSLQVHKHDLIAGSTTNNLNESITRNISVTEDLTSEHLETRKSRKFRRAIVLWAMAFLCGCQSGITLVLGKLLGELMEQSQTFFAFDLSVLICTFSIAFSASLQLLFISWLMRTFDAVVCIPPLQIFVMLFMIAFGSFCFGETPIFPSRFAFSILLALFGIGLLSTDTEHHVAEEIII